MISRLLGMPLWRPLKDRLFRWLFAGEETVLLADQMFLLALTLLVLDIAGPGVQLGTILAVASVPGALLMLVGGWVADRFPPAAVLVASNAGRAALMAPSPPSPLCSWRPRQSPSPWRAALRTATSRPTVRKPTRARTGTWHRRIP